MAFLSVCPRIKRVRNHLQVTTPWVTRLLCLGSFFKRAIFDPTAKTVVVTTNYLWFVRRVKIVPFSDIYAVTYGYGDLSTDQYLSYSHDSVDRFTVGLRLHGRDEIHLFSFTGEGTRQNNGPFPDWFYWLDNVFDVEGSQQNESRVLVDLISKMINVAVVPPSP